MNWVSDIYIQNGHVLARIEQADIGCTNGVIHIVSSVFRLDQFTVLDAIKGNNQLLWVSEKLLLYGMVIKTEQRDANWMSKTPS